MDVVRDTIMDAKVVCFLAILGATYALRIPIFSDISNCAKQIAEGLFDGASPDSVINSCLPFPLPVPDEPLSTQTDNPSTTAAPTKPSSVKPPIPPKPPKPPSVKPPIPVTPPKPPSVKPPIPVTPPKPPSVKPPIPVTPPKPPSVKPPTTAAPTKPSSAKPSTTAAPTKPSSAKPSTTAAPTKPSSANPSTTAAPTKPSSANPSTTAAPTKPSSANPSTTAAPTKPSSANPSTTSKPYSTAEPSTTTEQSSTTEPSTTTEQSSTTEPSTTTEQSSTTEPSTTTEQSTTPTEPQDTTTDSSGTTSDSRSKRDVNDLVSNVLKQNDPAVLQGISPLGNVTLLLSKADLSKINTVPKIPAPRSLNSLPAASPLGKSLKQARNLLVTTLGSASDFQTAIQEATIRAIHSPNPVDALTNLCYTVLNTYYSVMENSPFYIMSTAVMQEGVTVAANILRSVAEAASDVL